MEFEIFRALYIVSPLYLSESDFRRLADRPKHTDDKGDKMRSAGERLIARSHSWRRRSSGASSLKHRSVFIGVSSLEYLHYLH